MYSYAVMQLIYIYIYDFDYHVMHPNCFIHMDGNTASTDACNLFERMLNFAFS